LRRIETLDGVLAELLGSLPDDDPPQMDVAEPA
jgi:hypothetical protein